ncbi:acyltransferase family protein [Bacillus sp. FJAT-29814]|uniref:acyltransferase family protein n=1 Tax=Bacillus sp. FJAT-29814 TaxID=1729688 RepID=UPI0008351DB8|nr:acyltransferase family protein [Bacillus sp. FJAT-29814]
MGERRFDIDWLRNLGILLLFPFHSARVFDYWDPFYVKSAELSWGLSWFIAVTSYWFMPLLFWLAGSASWYALERRSNRQYMKDRVNRLLIPLIVGVLFIVPPQGYFARLNHNGEGGNYFSFLKTFFTDFSDLSGYFGTFTPAHLWFILYLFVLSLAALPIFSFFRKRNFEKFNEVCSRPSVFIALFLLLVVTEALPAPGGQNPFFFLVIFIMGFITSSQPSYQKMFNRVRGMGLVVLLVTVPLWVFLLTKDFQGAGFLLAVLKTFNLWLTLIVLLGYGNKFLNFKHKAIPYMNEAAFPVYIIHQSVLVVMGYFILKLNLGNILAFLIIMVLTFVISLLIYEFIIKRLAILRWAFGVKVKPAAVQKQNIEVNREIGKEL